MKDGAEESQRMRKDLKALIVIVILEPTYALFQFLLKGNMPNSIHPVIMEAYDHHKIFPRKVSSIEEMYEEYPKLEKAKEIVAWKLYDYYALVLVLMANNGATKTWRDLDFEKKYTRDKLQRLNKEVVKAQLSEPRIGIKQKIFIDQKQREVQSWKKPEDFKELFDKICKETCTEALFSIRDFFKN